MHKLKLMKNSRKRLMRVWSRTRWIYIVKINSGKGESERIHGIFRNAVFGLFEMQEWLGTNVCWYTK